MAAIVFWGLATAGLFLWNHFGGRYYIGIRFTDPPVNGAWLAAALTLYCSLRYAIRKMRASRRGAGEGPADREHPRE
ncbi:MAG: hypothetical protein JXR96_24565 [Deltaproteobacteria bacterium]|nr:hypothetical protein [Deltaproteobacteria bacterium]